MEKKYPKIRAEISEDKLDEAYHLIHKALYVQLPTRRIHLDTIPRDGNEYIHKLRLEDANIIFRRVPTVAPLENEHTRMQQAARIAALEFCRLGLKLKYDKDRIFLQQKFPKKINFPKNQPDCIKDWCVFCLGSKLCSKIYTESYEEPSEEIEGHLPVLSIILYFDQYTVYIVLKNLHEWFLSIGMEESLGRWVYAVLALIRKPLDNRSEKLIKTFYYACKKRLKDCNESEKSRLYQIFTIFENYFCILSDKLGTFLPLENLWKLV